MKLTQREEKFARLLIEGKSQSDAYREVYPHAKRWKPESVWSQASRLAVKVNARVQALSEEAADKAALTRAWVLERLMQNAEICLGKEPEPGTDKTRYDPQAANRALELLGKTEELRLFVERKESANTNYTISDQPLTEDEWAAEYADDGDSVH